jgi:hypothetical protein
MINQVLPFGNIKVKDSLLPTKKGRSNMLRAKARRYAFELQSQKPTLSKVGKQEKAPQ